MKESKTPTANIIVANFSLAIMVFLKNAFSLFLFVAHSH